MKRTLLSILLLSWACGDRVPVRSTTPQDPPPTASAPLAASTLATPDPGPARTDFTTHDPPFPASVVLPEGVVAKTIWKRVEDDNGLLFEFAQVAVTLGEKTLVIETRERTPYAATPQHIHRKREREEKKGDKNGIFIDERPEDGSLAFAFSRNNRPTKADVRGYETARDDYANRMYPQPVLILGKSEDGWRINSVVIRRREIFEPVTKEQREEYMRTSEEDRVDWVD